jgi:UDP-N-acetylglucosamine 2-epimerase
MKIATIIGARPQFIKAAAISRAIVEHNRDNSVPVIEEVIIHTGQHYDDDMSAIFFRELEIPEPKYHLNIGSGSHGRQTGQMLMAIEEVLLKEKPDWVLIYGDTNSTLAGALAAAKLHIRIAHVEAGLRSFNRLIPEEINRIVADQLSHLLLCPSQVAVNNLAVEGIGKNEGLRPFFSEKGKTGATPFFPEVKRGVVPAFPGNRTGAVPVFSPKVVITGDVMADALQFAASKVSAHSDILARLELQP